MKDQITEEDALKMERAFSYLAAVLAFDELPPGHVLRALNWLSCQPLADAVIGKRLQKEYGLDAIPPVSECETGAGFWWRVWGQHIRK